MAPADVDGDEGPAERLRQARSIASVEEARDLYERWADEYDRDVYSRLGFTGPDHVAARVVALVPTTARAGVAVLDAGCGTGAVGTRLAGHGFGPIDGLDLSPAMLRVARATGAYRTLLAADLNEPLGIADGRYDAVVSAGTFVSGHVRAEALRELVRVTQGGGILVFTVMDAFWDAGGFAHVVPELIGRGIVVQLADTVVPVTPDATSVVRIVSLRRPPAP